MLTTRFFSPFFVRSFMLLRSFVRASLSSSKRRKRKSPSHQSETSFSLETHERRGEPRRRSQNSTEQWCRRSVPLQRQSGSLLLAFGFPRDSLSFWLVNERRDGSARNGPKESVAPQNSLIFFFFVFRFPLLPALAPLPLVLARLG